MKAIPKPAGPTTGVFDTYLVEQAGLERAGQMARQARPEQSAVAPAAFAASIRITLNPAVVVRPLGPVMRIDALPREPPPRPSRRRRRAPKPGPAARRRIKSGG